MVAGIVANRAGDDQKYHRYDEHDDESERIVEQTRQPDGKSYLYKRRTQRYSRVILYDGLRLQVARFADLFSQGNELEEDGPLQ